MPTTRRAPEASAASEPGLRVLKKYPNRRLYDTQTSSYITLADVKQMVMDGGHFEVRDAKSGEDLTRSILLQIILEEETAGAPMFSSQMLAQIIRFYGHTMQGVMGSYLEKNLQAFIDLQTRFADQTGGLYEGRAFTPEAWTQFLSGQTPALQHWMTGMLDPSKNMFSQVQEQMQKQAESLFPGLSAIVPPPKR